MMRVAIYCIFILFLPVHLVNQIWRRDDEGQSLESSIFNDHSHFLNNQPAVKSLGSVGS